MKDLLDGLYHWGLSKYDGRSCVSRVRMCWQVRHRSTQIENRIVNCCGGNEKIDSYYLLSNLILLMNLLILHVKKSSIAVLMSMNATQMDCECWSETFQQSDYPKMEHLHNDLEPPSPRLVCFVQLLGVSPSHAVTKLCSFIFKWNI